MIKKMSRIALIVQKIGNSYSLKSSPKKGKTHVKKSTSFSSESHSPPRQKKRELKGITKRSVGEDSQVCLPLYYILIPWGLRMRKRTKKLRNSVLHQMRINLNENPRVCFSEKYIPENNLLSSICEVHPTPDNLNQVKKMHKSLEEKKRKKK